MLTDKSLLYRRERLYESEAEVPFTLRMVVVAGTLLTIVTSYFFPRTAFNATAVGPLSLGLVFFFIVAMDRPLCGTESIGPAPIEPALLKMEHWNEVMRNATAAATAPASK